MPPSQAGTQMKVNMCFFLFFITSLPSRNFSSHLVIPTMCYAFLVFFPSTKSIMLINYVLLKVNENLLYE